MSNTLTEEKQVCSCGRSFSHCKLCGSKNVYVKKARSFEFSEQIGRQGYVLGCRRCMRETLSEGQECKALPLREFNPEYTVQPVKANTKPWGLLTPNSDEYLNLFTQTAVELIQKKKITLMDAYVTLLKQGWPLAEENMSDELKEYLRDKGMMASETQPSQEQTSSTEGQVPLDEIIKAMQEEQK